MKLEAYLEQYNISTYESNGKTYYLGCGISSILGFKNTTVAMKKNEKNPRISTCNWKSVRIKGINKEEPVYIFNLDGVKELIYNSHNETCKYIKFHIDPCCPVSSNTLDDYFD